MPVHLGFPVLGIALVHHGAVVETQELSRPASGIVVIQCDGLGRHWTWTTPEDLNYGYDAVIKRSNDNNRAANLVSEEAMILELWHIVEKKARYWI